MKNMKKSISLVLALGFTTLPSLTMQDNDLSSFVKNTISSNMTIVEFENDLNHILQNHSLKDVKNCYKKAFFEEMKAIGQKDILRRTSKMEEHLINLLDINIFKWREQYAHRNQILSTDLPSFINGTLSRHKTLTDFENELNSILQTHSIEDVKNCYKQIVINHSWRGNRMHSKAEIQLMFILGLNMNDLIKWYDENPFDEGSIQE